jgi:hypothetical protein
MQHLLAEPRLGVRVSAKEKVKTSNIEKVKES